MQRYSESPYFESRYSENLPRYPPTPSYAAVVTTCRPICYLLLKPSHYIDHQRRSRQHNAGYHSAYNMALKDPLM